MEIERLGSSAYVAYTDMDFGFADRPAMLTERSVQLAALTVMAPGASFADSCALRLPPPAKLIEVAVADPRTGATSVGEVASTTGPAPVAIVAPVPPCAIARGVPSVSLPLIVAPLRVGLVLVTRLV